MSSVLCPFLVLCFLISSVVAANYKLNLYQGFNDYEIVGCTIETLSSLCASSWTSSDAVGFFPNITSPATLGLVVIRTAKAGTAPCLYNLQFKYYTSSAQLEYFSSSGSAQYCSLVGNGLYSCKDAATQSVQVIIS